MARMRHDLRAAQDRVGLPRQRLSNMPHRTPPHAKLVQAQHPGTCPGCGDGYEPGARIHRLGRGWGHLGCSRVGDKNPRRER